VYPAEGCASRLFVCPVLSGFDRAVAIAPDGSRVFVTGQATGGRGTGWDAIAVAYDATSGAAVWSQTLDMSSDDLGIEIALSPDGSRVFITGGTHGSNGYDYLTAAYDASSGSKLWVSTYDGPANGDDQALAVAASPDGSKVFVTGASEGLTSGQDFATVAYDATTGSQVWAARYDGPGHSTDQAVDVLVSSDGSRVFTLGTSAGATYDIATVAYDASTGTQQWAARYDGPAHGSDFAEQAAVSPSGSRVFVTGVSNGAGTDDWATIAYDASTGSPLWAARHSPSAGDFAVPQGIAAAPNGKSVYVAGDTTVTPSDAVDAELIGYAAASGTERWDRTFAGSGNGTDYWQQVIARPDGKRVYVVGTSVGKGSGDDIATAAYASGTGKQAWVAKLDFAPGGSDTAGGLAVNPAGTSVFVTGYLDIQFEIAMETAAYKA
jgi:WD40 repeat protein